MFAVPEGSRALFSSIVFSIVHNHSTPDSRQGAIPIQLFPYLPLASSELALVIIGRQSLTELTSCNVHTWESILLQKSFAFADSGFCGTNERFQNRANFRERELT